MTHPAQVYCEIRTALPASLQAIEEFFVEFRRHQSARPHAGSWFAAELLVREALTNAVLHGCHADPRRLVRCVLRLKGSRLLIAVEDDGDGFDWRAAWSHPAALTDCSGRGIGILRKYANHVRYNDRGNVVMIVKRLC
ncbi:MAG: ATP-binding protein [Bryobacteraceae bacterium]